MIYIFVFILNISLFINCSILQAYSISNENKAKEYVKLCYDYNNRARYNLAISACTKAINLYPYDYYAYFKRGLAYGYKKQYDLAIKDYSRSIILNPNYAPAYYNRGWAYGEKKEYDLAIKDYTKAIKLNPNNKDAYYNRGFAYVNERLYDLAIRDFSFVLKKDPGYERAYFWRGFAYGEKGEYDLAIKDYSNTIKLNPYHAGAYCNRGFGFSKKGLYNLAIKDYTSAINIDPKMTIAYLNRGIVFGYLNKWEKALTDFRALVYQNPTNPFYRLDYGFVLSKANQIEEARRQIQLALKSAPTLLQKRGNYLSSLYFNKQIFPTYFYAEEYLFASRYTSVSPEYLNLSKDILKIKTPVGNGIKRVSTPVSKHHCVKPYPNRYLFAILISNYSELPELTFVKHDKQILLKLATCFLGVPDENIMILENSSLGRIKHRARNFFSNITKKDALVFVYYSGHGITDTKGEFYLLPKDASVDSEEDLKETGLSIRELSKKISLARGLKLAMIDACRVPLAWKPAVLIRKETGPKDMALLFGTKPGKTSVKEKEGESSAFISALYQMATSGLTNIDQNDDGYVEIDELIMPLKKWIRKVSSDPSQSPEVWGKRDIPVFPVE